MPAGAPRGAPDGSLPCPAVLRLALALLVAVCALATGSVAGAAPIVGIADQKPDMFADPRFHDLRIRHARLYVPWDVRSHPGQLAEVDRWMQAAFARGVRPLVTFGHSRVERRSLPSPERFMYEFRRFRERYPWVRTFATWNEANHCGEPTCRRPKLVAAYWRVLRRACPGCRVLAAEVLDQPNAVAWIREFRRHARVRPRLWGVHNYVEANRFRTERLRGILAATGGAQVWLTEVAGIVWRRSRRPETVRKGIPESAAHAARVLRFLLDDVLPRHRQITRLYVYHWNITRPRDAWDSALISADGRRRPAFRVLERALRDGR